MHGPRPGRDNAGRCVRVEERGKDVACSVVVRGASGCGCSLADARTAHKSRAFQLRLIAIHESHQARAEGVARVFRAHICRSATWTKP